MSRIFGAPIQAQKTATIDGLPRGTIKIPRNHEFLTLTPVPPKGDVWAFVVTDPPLDMNGKPRPWLEDELVTIEYALVGMGQDIPAGHTFRQELITPNGPIFFYEKPAERVGLIVPSSKLGHA